MKYRHVSSRLDRVEARLDIQAEEEDTRQRQMVLESARHAIATRAGEKFGHFPLFWMDDHGNVYATHDDKLITRSIQVLAENFYWMEMTWRGHQDLVHDEEREAFYTHTGKLVLSRDYVSLPGYLGDRCECEDCRERRGEG
jgi:hypothetical protein